MSEVTAASHEVHMPPAVRRQIDEAAAIHANAIAAQRGENFDPVVGENIDGEIVVVAPPAPPVVDAPTPEAPAPVAPATAAPVDDGYEQRYRVLQGKYNRELPQALERIRVLEEQNASLHGQFAAATAVVPVSAREVEEYGPELIDLIGRRAQEVSIPRVTQLEQEVRTLQQQTISNQAVIEAQRDADYWRALHGQIPGGESAYSRINADPVFLAWLQEHDQYSGELRKKLLMDAYHRRDPARSAAFFLGYMTEYPTGAVPVPTLSQVPVNLPRTPVLDTLVAPGRRAGGTNPGNAGGAQAKRMWTQTDISAFYAERTAGKYASLDPAEVNAVELDILAAGMEGRVIL